MRRIDEQKVIELYAEHDSCRKVADIMGVSEQTVRRRLMKHGIKRTGNRMRKAPTQSQPHGNCGRYRNCPALIVMLYEAGRSTCEICAELGISSGYIDNLKRKGLLRIRKHRTCPALAVMLYELTDMGSVSVAREIGVSSTYVLIALKQAGIDPSEHGKGRSRFADELARRYGDAFECVSLGDGAKSRKTLRCNACGAEFTFYPDWNNRISCPECARREREAADEARREERDAERQRRLAVVRRCAWCWSEFQSEHENARYCSAKCRRAAHGYGGSSDHRRRAMDYGVPYEPGITLDALIARDGNKCGICGGECDRSDRSWGSAGPFYPSIDHIVAMANGGGHTWDNVQLAHCMCNSAKRDLDMEATA